MPTYAYRCKLCGNQFDEWQKISDEPLVTCPSCNKNSLVRIIDGGAGLIFKGSGFYLTDYKKGGDKAKTHPPEKKQAAPDVQKSDKPTK
jgi:putative FmdB family regulatory protein